MIIATAWLVLVASITTAATGVPHRVKNFYKFYSNHPTPFADLHNNQPRPVRSELYQHHYITNNHNGGGHQAAVYLLISTSSKIYCMKLPATFASGLISYTNNYFNEIKNYQIIYEEPSSSGANGGNWITDVFYVKSENLIYVNAYNSTSATSEIFTLKYDKYKDIWLKRVLYKDQPYCLGITFNEERKELYWTSTKSIMSGSTLVSAGSKPVGRVLFNLDSAKKLLYLKYDRASEAIYVSTLNYVYACYLKQSDRSDCVVIARDLLSARGLYLDSVNRYLYVVDHKKKKIQRIKLAKLSSSSPSSAGTLTNEYLSNIGLALTNQYQAGETNSNGAAGGEEALGPNGFGQSKTIVSAETTPDVGDIFYTTLYNKSNTYLIIWSEFSGKIKASYLNDTYNYRVLFTTNEYTYSVALMDNSSSVQPISHYMPHFSKTPHTYTSTSTSTISTTTFTTTTTIHTTPTTTTATSRFTSTIVSSIVDSSFTPPLVTASTIQLSSAAIDGFNITPLNTKAEPSSFTTTIIEAKTTNFDEDDKSSRRPYELNDISGYETINRDEEKADTVDVSSTTGSSAAIDSSTAKINHGEEKKLTKEESIDSRPDITQILEAQSNENEQTSETKEDMPDEYNKIVKSGGDAFKSNPDVVLNFDQNVKLVTASTISSQTSIIDEEIQKKTNTKNTTRTSDSTKTESSLETKTSSSSTDSHDRTDSNDKESFQINRNQSDKSDNDDDDDDDDTDIENSNSNDKQQNLDLNLKKQRILNLKQSKSNENNSSSSSSSLSFDTNAKQINQNLNPSQNLGRSSQLNVALYIVVSLLCFSLVINVVLLYVSKMRQDRNKLIITHEICERTPTIAVAGGVSNLSGVLAQKHTSSKTVSNASTDLNNECNINLINSTNDGANSD
jgi:hypothetical protein